MKNHDTAGCADIIFSFCTIEMDVREKLATRIIQTMSAVFFLLNMLAIASYVFVQKMARPVERRVEVRSDERR
ncbi:hypothetical protein [Rhizobium tibeticum]|uniref:hypothetical protein n=1 Tax=Rhizobium tibeticum TaxID=501024 RepID=UPI0009319BDD|nr:hypothetical protein [Rhizobium tibeticum]